MTLRSFFSLTLCLCTGMLLTTISPTAALGQNLQKSRALAPRSTEPAKPAEENQCLDGSMSEWMLRERIVFVTGEINADLAESVIAQLLYLDAQAPGQDIYLYINSGGGFITAGLAILDVMRSLRSEVVTVSMGASSSMASLILTHGSRGKRFVLPNSRIMIHQPSSEAYGKASDIAIEAKEISYFKSKLNRMLAEMTGQPLSRIETDTDRDFFMSAEEAKAYGLVDRIVKRLPSASNPTGK